LSGFVSSALEALWDDRVRVGKEDETDAAPLDALCDRLVLLNSIPATSVIVSRIGVCATWERSALEGVVISVILFSFADPKSSFFVRSRVPHAFCF